MDLTTERVSVAPIRWRPIVVPVLALMAVAAAVLFAAGSRPPPPLPAPAYGPAANGLIAYESDGDIYLGDPVTGASRAIVTGPEVDISPNFSRDGTKLLFLRAVHDNAHQLVLADADGTDARLVTPTTFIAITGGDWTGDGRYLAIASAVDNILAISIVDITNGNVRTLDLGRPAYQPAFRPPDGRQIAYTVGIDSGAGIYVVDTVGGLPIRLADGGGPTYSPDGSRIAFGRSYQPFVERNEARVMNADGSDDHIVGDRPDVQYQGTAIWSPDGTQLLMYRNSKTSGLVLAMAPADGSSPGREFNVPFYGGFGGISWSPDGSQIVSMSGDEGLATLVNLADGRPRLVPRWYTSSWQRLAFEEVDGPTPAPAGR